MTAQSSGDCGLPMKRERDAAIRAISRFATIAAQQRSGKTAPVQKQDRLFSFLEPIGDGVRNFSDRIAAFFSFPPFLAQIDNANERHLLFDPRAA